MNSLQIHMQCFLRALTFNGRATRAEFWTFLPLGAFIPLVALYSLIHLGWPIPFALATFFLLGLPLAATGARRLQDTGESGLGAVLPWFAFGGAIMFASWGADVSAHIDAAFAQEQPPDGPVGFGFVLMYGLSWLLLCLCSLALIINFLIRITPAFGQTLVASQPGDNRFGPNPNEVPS